MRTGGKTPRPNSAVRLDPSWSPSRYRVPEPGSACFEPDPDSVCLAPDPGSLFMPPLLPWHPANTDSESSTASMDPSKYPPA